MANDKEKKDNNKDEEVIIGEGLEDIVTTGADKDKEKPVNDEEDKDKEKEEKDKDKEENPKPSAEWKKELKKINRGRIPDKYVIYKMRNKVTGEYVVDVEKYKPHSKGKSDLIDPKKLRGKYKKDWVYEPIEATITEDDAYDAAIKFITDNKVVEDEKSLMSAPLVKPVRVRGEVVYERRRGNPQEILADGVIYNSMKDARKSTGKPLREILRLRRVGENSK